MIRPLICAIAALAAGAPAVCAQDAVQARVDAVFSAYARDAAPGCALGVYRDGAITYTRGYGLADVDSRAPIARTTIFDIGSTSKQFTAAAILLLAQDGRLSLDDDVRRFIPELPQYGTPVTIRHLLHHTSGIRDYISLLLLGGAQETGSTTAKDALDAIARQRALNFEPGSEHLYSNSGYFLLSQIVERISGKSMAEFSADRIFRPLGMNATYIRDRPGMDPAARAKAYAATGGGFSIYMSEWEQTGDGAVQTSIDDLQKWDENFYHHRVGGRALIDELERIDSLNNGTPLTYARGLFVNTHRGLRRVSHGGAWAGYRAELMRIPSRHLSVAVLCNVANSDPSLLAQQVLDAYLGDVSAPAAATDTAMPKPVQLPEAELRRWTGRYRNPATGTVRNVTFANAALSAQFGADALNLMPVGAAEFFVVVGANRLTLRFEGTAPGRRMRQLSGGIEVAVFEELSDVQSTDGDREALAGRYTSDELRTTFTIARNGGALSFEFSGGALPMQPLQRDMWAAGPFTVRVTRGADGQVSGFLLDQGRARGIVFTRMP